MGITIHYRGTVDDLSRVEELEDRVVDLALAMGGKARIWRSVDDATNSRMIRGLILDLAPGLDSTSLLISPEGHLINLFEIEEAEKNPVVEPPWCFCKTQFGNPEAHVALVELLTALRRDFLSNLEVLDEGDYWETRDFRRLAERVEFLGAAIKGMADGLRTHGLNAEAAEDPDIVATRIERIAAVVHQTMQNRSSQNCEVGLGFEAMFRQNAKRAERMQRIIGEELGKGATANDAFEKALASEGLAVPTDAPYPSFAGDEDDDGDYDEFVFENQFDLGQEQIPYDDADDVDDVFDRREHPLQRQASELLLEVFRYRDELDDENGRKLEASTLFNGMMEVVGGLAQSCGSDVPRGLVDVQLKRALRGLAFAKGALYGLMSTSVIPQPPGERWLKTLEQIEHSVYEMMVSDER